MANVKYTDQQWKKAREYFEVGLSLSKISEKTGIKIPGLSKRATKEGWSKETEKKQLVIDATRVAVAKSNLKETALEVHNEIVNERSFYTKFFNDAASQNVKEAMDLGCETQQDYKLRSETIAKGREVVLGKTPDTALQVNVGSQSGNDPVNSNAIIGLKKRLAALDNE